MSTPITIAPHLEKALDVMSKDMAVAPEALVNQAVFAWLRINGYVLPSGAEVRPAAPAVVSAPPPAPAPPSSTSSSQVNLGVVAAPAAVAPSPVSAPSSAPEAPAPAPVVASQPTPAPLAAPPVSSPSGSGASELQAALDRMKAIDADLEKLARPWPAWSPQPVEDEVEDDEEQQDSAVEEPAEDDEAEASADEDDAAEEAPADEEAAPPEDEVPPPEEEEDEAAAAENTGETEVAPPEPDEEEPPPESTIVLKSIPIALYIQRGDEEPIRVESERFIIGRGPHCDLVIDSPRVSREHAALTRSGVMYFIEDLNSSNGTWFNEERVTKKELESGDVINLGNEPVTFILRGE